MKYVDEKKNSAIDMQIRQISSVFPALRKKGSLLYENNYEKM